MGPERDARICLGAGRLASSCGARQPPRLRLSVRRGLSGPCGRCGDHHAGGQQRGDEPAPQGDQHASIARRACRPACDSAGWHSTGPATARANQRLASATATLLAVTQPDREHLGPLAGQQTQHASLGWLSRNHHRVPQRVELPDLIPTASGQSHIAIGHVSVFRAGGIRPRGSTEPDEDMMGDAVVQQL